jgi:hypothetical protein
MDQTLDRTTDLAVDAALSTDAVATSYRAYQILRAAFTVIPIVAGVDKFFHFLVDWDKYLPHFADRITGGRGHELMLAAGVIEILAGLGVWLRPRMFAYVVAGWLLMIIVNLIMISTYFDIVLRDFGLAVGAIVLADLSQEFSKQAVAKSREAVGKLVSKHVVHGTKAYHEKEGNKDDCDCK